MKAADQFAADRRQKESMLYPETQLFAAPINRSRLISTDCLPSPTQMDLSCTVTCNCIARWDSVASAWLSFAGMCHTVRLRRRVGRFSRSFHQIAEARNGYTPRSVGRAFHDSISAIAAAGRPWCWAPARIRSR
jgi:hypothetical protein